MIQLQVFRIYDNRFHKCSRSATIYKMWEPLCRETTNIVSCGLNQNCHASGFIDRFSTDSPDGSLALISTPFREGEHCATFPTDFVPIIDQLEKLHEDGFVHGDIRAYNLVFGKREKNDTPQSWLIDFDFGGNSGVVCYPPGYKSTLTDRSRCGEEGEQIERWHDWYALGAIIFNVHWPIPPPNPTSPLDLSLASKACKLSVKWGSLEGNDDITNQDIQELRDFLQSVEACGWTVGCSTAFARDLKRR